jgi:integrase
VLLAVAPREIELALILALWTGQRQGDLLRLPWSACDGTHIRLRQSKTGRRVAMPAGQPLKLLLDQTERRGPILLTNTYGRPWTSDGFRTSWGSACRKAGIAGLTFHDLRGSAVVRLALVEATVPQIATFTGHSLKDVDAILDAHYLGRDVQLAEAAVLKLEQRTKTVK